MSIDARQAIDLARLGPRAKRLAVSHLERCLAGTLHAWALRAVFVARLEAAGQAPRPLVDVWLLPRVTDA